MKIFLLVILLSTTSIVSFARNDIADYSVIEAMSINKISSAIGNDVSFFFAGQVHSKVDKVLGEFQSNKKTNSFGKSDKEACQWVFASAMKSLRERAIKEGGNSVINIRSNYKGNMTSSSTTFKCGVGAIIAGVTLVGDVVKLNKMQTKTQSQNQQVKSEGKLIINRDLVKKTQTKLNESGFKAGVADGLMGNKTLQAIKEFQSLNSLSITGKIDRETLDALSIGYGN